jgi:hypothetical protein
MAAPTHVVVIEWRDSWYAEGAVQQDEARSYAKIICGFLIQEILEGDDPGVLIAWEINETNSREMRQWIPLQMIKRMRRYKIR